MKYYSIGEFANKIGKSIQTLRNWDKKNILKPSHVTQGGTRYYSQEQLNHFLGLKSEQKINKKIIGYCRVSSHKQKDDLERQIDNVKTYMYAKGYQFEIITDIGSGINYTKKGCLLYTSDAADDGYSVDLGGRRIIKKIFFKQKTAYEISEGLVGSEMCIRDRC